MKIQIVSDLHIESLSVVNYSELIIPTAEVLILAGDIGSLYKITQLTQFLKNVCSMFKKVLYIPGNHEYYIVDGIQPVHFSVLEQRLFTFEKIIPNLKILNRRAILYGKICIAGATLWSNPACEIPKYIVRIHGFTTQIYYQKYLRDLEYVKNMVEFSRKNNFDLHIVTHYPPLSEVLLGSRKKMRFLSYYVNNLEHVINFYSVKTWIYGHTHFNNNFVYKKCNIISNQKGKFKDNNTDFKNNFIINI